MRKTINKNDIVIINKNVENLNTNDIVAISKNNQTIINRIYQLEGKKDNQIVLIKGDNNLYPSNEIINNKDIEGKIIFKIPWIGGFVIFLQSNIMSFIVIILLIWKIYINKELKRRNKLIHKNFLQ